MPLDLWVPPIFHHMTRVHLCRPILRQRYIMWRCCPLPNFLLCWSPETDLIFFLRLLRLSLSSLFCLLFYSTKPCCQLLRRSTSTLWTRSSSSTSRLWVWTKTRGNGGSTPSPRCLRKTSKGDYRCGRGNTSSSTGGWSFVQDGCGLAICTKPVFLGLMTIIYSNDS